MRKKLQWNFNRYSSIFIQENAFENVVCEMASILSRPQCDNGSHNTVATASSYGMGTLAPHNTPHNTLCLYGGYLWQIRSHPDSKVHGANMWHIWGRQYPGGPHVGPINFAIWANKEEINQIRASKVICVSSQRCTCLVTWGPFYSHALTLIPAWIKNHMPLKVRDESTYLSQTSTVQPFGNGYVISSPTFWWI